LRMADQSFQPELLQRLLEAETRRLDSMRRSSAPWFHLLRQHWRILQVHRAARWWQRDRPDRSRFIWRVGILGWGTPMFIVTEFALPIARGSMPRGAELAFQLVLGVLVWGGASYLFGRGLWRSEEKVCQRLLEEGAVLRE